MKFFYSSRKPNSGQATLELAIFGALSLMIVAAMINYGLTLATQQELEMYAFRRALQFSQARYNGGGAARQAGFTAFKEVYPVALAESGAERQRVSGSASINWEFDSGTLTGEDPQDFGVQYWQLGRRMMKNNQVIEMPRMKVKRQRDENETRGFLDYVWESIISTGGDDEVDVWQAAPVDQTLTDNLKISQARDNIQEINGRVTNRQNISSQEDNQMTMVMQSDAKIKQWDPEIIEIHEKPGDIIISEQEVINKDKTWETPVK